MIPEGNGLGQVGCGVNRLLWLSFADAECVCVRSCAMSRCVGRFCHDVCDVLRVQCF